jgi:hypothetical protein
MLTFINEVSVHKYSMYVVHVSRDLTVVEYRLIKMVCMHTVCMYKHTYSMYIICILYYNMCVHMYIRNMYDNDSMSTVCSNVHMYIHKLRM